MTDLTDDQVRALLDEATPGSWRADGEPWNRVVWSSADNRVCFMSHSNGLNDERDIATSNLAAAAPDLARALLQARADTEAAVALALEEAVEAIKGLWKWDDEGWLVERPDMKQAEEAIRALAPDAGTAELAKLRERAEKAEQERVAEWNRRRDADGSRDAARAACDTMRAERDTLAAELAQADLRAKNAYMRGLLDSAQHLRSTIPDKPEGWEQVESMARMLDAMATREAARHIAEGQK